MLPDTTGSRKSKMAADKPEVVITRRCEDISTWSRGYDTVFGHARSPYTCGDTVRLRRTPSGTHRK